MKPDKDQVKHEDSPKSSCVSCKKPVHDEDPYNMAYGQCASCALGVDDK